MADTAIKSEEEKKEFFDPPDVLEQKCDQLAFMIRSSEHFVAFTGAGISTSAGIPDFRSGVNTVLETGPGAWEKAAFKAQVKDKKYFRQSIQKAIPTSTHMAFVGLMDAGYLKFIISQNVDGLHRKSGIPPEKITELHGNTNVELCTKCQKEYLRDFRVRNAQKVHDHKTGRRCDDPVCKGDLIDTIINFNENLRDSDLDLGFGHSAEADLHLVLGSSLRVTPAASMPVETVKKGGKLVIVNLQKTPLDYEAALIINAKCDEVMRRVMKKLEIQIPEFRLQRRFQAELIPSQGEEYLQIRGVDVNLSPYSLFTQIQFKGKGQKEAGKVVRKEPFQIIIDKKYEYIMAELSFQGHYDEPKFQVEIDLKELKNNKNLLTYLMVFNPFEGVWEFCIPA